MRKKIPRENRKCLCGCGKTFECKENSAQKYIYGHNRRHKHHSTATRKKMSKVHKEYYKNNPGAAKKRSEAMAGNHHSTATRKKMSESQLEYYKNNPERQKKISKAMTGRHHSEDAIKKMSVSQLERHRNNPEIARGKNNSFYGKTHSEASKKKMSKSGIEYYKNNPKARTGKNNPAWIEDRAGFMYSDKFNVLLRRQIRDRDNHTCQLCNKKESKKRKLDVHHIDYDKKNSKSANLISLCRVCHPKTGANRKYWTTLFKKKIKVIYKKIAA